MKTAVSGCYRRRVQFIFWTPSANDHEGAQGFRPAHSLLTTKPTHSCVLDLLICNTPKLLQSSRKGRE